MNLTNIYDLPEAVLNAVKNDPYTGGGDISVTKLIDSPQIRLLRNQYKDAIVEDVSDRIWSLLGQAVHTILERAGDKSAIQEERLYATVNGWQVSGQYDRMELQRKTLDDYKVTSTYKATGDLTSWEQQLNCLRWLAIQNGYEVEELRIIAFLRDWSKAKGLRDHEYPKQAVMTIQIPVWSMVETYEFIQDRVHIHQEAEKKGSATCSLEETWYSGDKFALMKTGGKRAIKLYDNRQDIPSPLADGTYIDERKGFHRRCQDYCEVAPFCKQYEPYRQADQSTEWESTCS